VLETGSVMKDQYFSDINDYRKYGLLRAILRVSGFCFLVAWMLTPNDGSTGGKFISYLESPDTWPPHDPILFRKIKELLSSGSERRIGLIENTNLLPNVEYFSSLVPDAAFERGFCFDSLVRQAHGSNFVFLGPDNGLEVKSRPYGCKGSSKYLYWREVDALWHSGKSLLIYQHFIREERLHFIQRMLKTLSDTVPDSFVEAFATPHVVFFMAL